MKLAYDIPEAAEQARTSRSQLYLEIAAGKLTARKRGRRTIILHEDLERYLRDLPEMKTA